MAANFIAGNTLVFLLVASVIFVPLARRAGLRQHPRLSGLRRCRWTVRVAARDRCRLDEPDFRARRPDAAVSDRPRIAAAAHLADAKGGALGLGPACEVIVTGAVFTGLLSASGARLARRAAAWASASPFRRQQSFCRCSRGRARPARDWPRRPRIPSRFCCSRTFSRCRWWPSSRCWDSRPRRRGPLVAGNCSKTCCRGRRYRARRPLPAATAVPSGERRQDQ